MSNLSEQLIIHPLSCQNPPGSRFFMLREDLLPEAFGGNKVRIAREYIRDLKEGGCDAMLIYGDRRSNLCRVLALLSRAEGIPVRMLAAPGEEPSAPSLNERLIRSCGVEIIPSSLDVAASVDEALARFKAEGKKPYYIFGSRLGRGNEGTAARAYAEVYRALLEWEAARGLHFDLIALPYGTGCTYGGLLAGMLLTGDIRETAGISISSRTRARAEEILEETVRGYFEKEGLPVPSKERVRSVMNLRTEYNCGGYGIVTEEVLSAVRDMLLSEGIGLPAVYGGKAWAGLCRYLRDKGTGAGNVLFIHTGGTPLFFDDLTGGFDL